MALTKAKFGVISSALASGNATDGYVLTADGSGNSAWEEVAGGVDGIVSSADATAITIDSSEKVGIGISSPAFKLQVSGTQNANDICSHNSTTGSSVRISSVDAYECSTVSLHQFCVSGEISLRLVSVCNECQ